MFIPVDGESGVLIYRQSSDYLINVQGNVIPRVIVKITSHPLSGYRSLCSVFCMIKTLFVFPYLGTTKIVFTRYLLKFLANGHKQLAYH